MTDALVARIAARQRGVVSLAQCLAAGLTRQQVKDRVAAGRWRRLHRGVFFLGAGPVDHFARYQAALLAIGDDARLAYRSAASVWGLQPHHGGAIHVVTTRKVASRPGIAVHWTRRLGPRDVATRRGLRTTALHRTLVDLADVAGAQELEEAIRAAERLHGLDREHLTPIHGRRGTRRLTDPEQLVRGHLEPLLLALCDEAGLQRPETNVRHGPYDLDALWRGPGVALEVDDWDTHRTREAFEADRVRDRALARDGLVAVRATYADLSDHRVRLAADLRALGVPTRGPG